MGKMSVSSDLLIESSLLTLSLNPITDIKLLKYLMAFRNAPKRCYFTIEAKTNKDG